MVCAAVSVRPATERFKLQHAADSSRQQIRLVGALPQPHREKIEKGARLGWQQILTEMHHIDR